ncbi:DUF4082 domain-containing protein [Microbacterium sp. zg.Y625]|uniref:DUF4082 domain-containing protein n=1 Tax=Microbacterium jiangjiandongii TaxID=3049071 RepID=UPI00214B0F94|nr:MULTISPECIES: DUF4082 domain-containing protein [unclassified Microbacterium]MCR2793564.1 DUF4082 domain-containing protein [Microbacterium sp. zg.Y625]WIM25918.1 DUF4082 domain-containing protein [Microbacterium sp. zg-Y625]
MTPASHRTAAPLGRPALAPIRLALAAAAVLILSVVVSHPTATAIPADPARPGEVTVFASAMVPANAGPVLTGTTAASASRSIFADSAKPAVPVDPDTRAVELGMRFTPATAGTVTGIRFFKTDANEGPHTGSLWSAQGELLARVVFATGSPEGWQTAALSSPVPLDAGQEYVVSYTAESGAYSVEENYFVRPNAVGGLQLPRAAGVYTYEAGGFPSQSHRFSNYFVDVSFVPEPDPGTGEPTPNPDAATGSVLDDAPSADAEDADTASVELGMRFSPKVDGTITGIRFFKTSGNDGPHRGTLWDADGEVLSRVTFAETSAEGWQLARLSAPVEVTAGGEYVVSYLATRGRYAAEDHFFDQGIDSPYLSVPAGAGVYAYGPGGFPTDNYLNSNYYVDIVFAPASTAPTPAPSPSPTPVPTTPAPTPRPTATPSPTPTPSPAPGRGGSVLDLPQEAWWGGAQYYSRFDKASAAGWDEDTFFPIAVFFGKPEHAGSLAAIGVNTYMGAEHDGSPLTSITNEGISVLAQNEWTPAEVSNNARVVGWHVSDECEMGYSDCTEESERGRLAAQQGFVSDFRSRNDGRFLQANFGNGVLGTYWAPTTMDEHVALMDVTSVDKYAYTSPHVQDLLPTSPAWPAGKEPASSGAYGWLQDQMETFASPAASRPNWVFIETAEPYLSEAGATSMTGQQIEGAVWNSIIHGAAGIAYFQHNSNGICGNYSLVECGETLRAEVKAINAEVTALAPVINSPSYRWDFGPGLETTLKARDGYAYIIAMTDGGTGSRSLELPAGVDGSVIEVIGEDRTLAAVDGTVVDTFTAEHDHHIYRLALRD